MPAKEQSGGKSKQIQAAKSAARHGAKQVKKKWSKVSTKEQKGAAAVLLDAPSYAKLISSVPTMKNITIASVADRLQCNLTVARRAIHMLSRKKMIKPLVRHGSFVLYTRFPAKEAELKAAEEAKAAAKKPQAQKKAKAASE
ncbi:putative small subunit ribosomal protein S25e [Monocercomonoides exilis]|uniref:putative small subunit ribosomal protein S25e n=1 Tax=Monocercomonoides exilis TaxID=2049356 RepID=UPI0035593AF0|nr:putative small subunit ribosomal protein S25e [Monocercomonoides exilis]|eukprot:MONOS_5140.1-p1 / transcript=MONOS_5140.1 / gene=MONOS_5140 / organism=Monocercomonoides_exilis_PA203 / gene_product=unspecified product / transcript_product=unspecified product / location=Mono_scaffold00146:76781-77429(-) / protein_length=141 / sequence_SO=supercontig / SO=protein_coding / is_pseudo=false